MRTERQTSPMQKRGPVQGLPLGTGRQPTELGAQRPERAPLLCPGLVHPSAARSSAACFLRNGTPRARPRRLGTCPPPPARLLLGEEPGSEAEVLRRHPGGWPEDLRRDGSLTGLSAGGGGSAWSETSICCAWSPRVAGKPRAIGWLRSAQTGVCRADWSPAGAAVGGTRRPSVGRACSPPWPHLGPCSSGPGFQHESDDPGSQFPFPRCRLCGLDRYLTSSHSPS